MYYTMKSNTTIVVFDCMCNTQKFFVMDKFLFFNKFIIFLYMFQAPLCSSSGGQNCIIQHLVSSHSVGGRPVHSSLSTCAPDGHLQTDLLNNKNLCIKLVNC